MHTLVNTKRYMAITETGAVDHLTNMAEKEMAIMPISNRSGIGTPGPEVFDILIVLSF
jgi:histidinol phosphatase-like enzyme